MPHGAEFSRLHEMNARPGMSEAAWAMEQQQQMRAYEESAANSAWAAEFGNAPQASAAPSIQQQQNGPERAECMYRVSSFVLKGLIGS